MDEQVLAWCKRLIECPSVTGDGTRAIVELCARELLRPHGIEARIIPSINEGPEQVNLVAMVKGREAERAPLVLNTHLDTVPPGDPQLWTTCGGDPFGATVENGRIYGLGAADTKLDFVAKAMALSEERQPRRDVWLVATFGEEHGLVGAKELVQSGIPPRGALAFVGEPSHLEVITAHKGLLVFALRIEFPRLPDAFAPAALRRLTFTGRAAHSSTPALGRNAIRMALDELAAHPAGDVVAIRGGDAVNKVAAACEVIVREVADRAAAGAALAPAADAPRGVIPHPAIAAVARFVTELQKFADRAGVAEPDYASPTLTCNPGRISSAGDTIVLDFELRPSPGLALEIVREGVAAIAREVEGTYTSIRLTVEERRANPGFRSARDRETLAVAMGALARAGLSLKTGVKAGCTEAGIYAAAGLDPVVFGPGPSTGVIHAPNEYNLLEEVSGAVRFYRELIGS
jgi:acetylornithine deacetylase/succinyl-diaminopimelate desuccinylase-like protein